MSPFLFRRPAAEYTDLLNDFTLSEVEKDAGGSMAAILIRPDMDPEEVERYILAHPDVTTLKPYMTYTSNPVKLQSRIDEFVPDWAWTLADKLRLSITLHIARYKAGLSDPDTLKTVIRRTTEHPNMRLILAHCALAHNPDTLKRALPEVRRLDNLYFDAELSGKLYAALAKQDPLAKERRYHFIFSAEQMDAYLDRLKTGE